jgi:hypothetical protein
VTTRPLYERASAAARATWRREPRIHSHVTDRLPDRHPLARCRVHCDRCESLLHLQSNSCMRTWIETGRGNFCLRCFVHAAGGATPDSRSELAGIDCLTPAFGLPTGAVHAGLRRDGS